tara:strand:- start:475 stop:615 length:141 start_codon:yes stop_codon:yes gene_type:complete
MKTKEAIKFIVANPHLFTDAEVLYAKMMKKVRKESKKARKALKEVD